MNRVFEAALEVQDFCEKHNFLFCFIGGLALQRWSEPRMTADADLTVITNLGEEEGVIDLFLAEFSPRIENAREFALVNRLLLLKSSGDIGLDIALGALPVEQRSVARASRYKLDKASSLVTCSAEDLVVHKAFANRDQDWVDIKSILIRQQGKLDKKLILSELTPLVELKEEPEILDRLKKLFVMTET